MYISDEVIEKFIKEDVPYMDLTTFVLGIGNQAGQISFIAREDMVLSGVEEVTRIFGKLGIDVTKSLPTGTLVESGETIITADGLAANLHMAWKVSLNILEYCCGIATKTRKLVEKAKSINQDIAIVTTRKLFPGTKELAIKSVIAGGGFPHRLGLSETILIFKQHINFIGGFDQLPKMVKQIRNNVCEKKIIVEVDNESDAFFIAEAGVDGLQFDKMPASDLKRTVEGIRRFNKNLTLIATGGVNDGNVQEYADTGVDAIATSSVYFGKPADIKVSIGRL
jgi:molybdenum transport protein